MSLANGQHIDASEARYRSPRSRQALCSFNINGEQEKESINRVRVRPSRSSFVITRLADANR